MMQIPKKIWLPTVVTVLVVIGAVMATNHFQTPDQLKPESRTTVAIIGAAIATNHPQTPDQQRQDSRTKRTSLEVQVDENAGWSAINAQVCGVAAGDQSGVNDGQVLTALGAFEADKAITDVVEKDLAYQFAVSDGAIRLVGPPKPGVQGDPGIGSADRIVMCGR